MADFDAVDAALARECDVFCRYLVGTPPNAAIARAYPAAHAARPELAARPMGALDRALLRVASRGPACARACDAFAGLFVRRSLLRKKTVLLVALLESVGETAAIADRIEPAGGGRFVLLVMGIGIRAVVMVGAAAAVVLPLAAWFRLTTTAAGRAAEREHGR